ncbi:MAG: DJ-1/PfpI family protein, partial [Candidatus Bathyarchaeota archaeon]
MNDVNPADYDAVVVVDGAGSLTHLGGNQKVQEIVKETARTGKLVSAICISPVVLARAGLLTGKKA